MARRHGPKQEPRQAPLDGVATEKEVNPPSRLAKSDLKAAGKALTKAKNTMDACEDAMLDMIAGGSEAPLTLEKAVEHLKAAREKIELAQKVVRTGEV